MSVHSPFQHLDFTPFRISFFTRNCKLDFTKWGILYYFSIKINIFQSFLIFFFVSK